MTKYWVEFSNGSIIKNLTADEMTQVENMPGRIIITWGVVK
jgi:hypothetical protein